MVFLAPVCSLVVEQTDCQIQNKGGWCSYPNQNLGALTLRYLHDAALRHRLLQPRKRKAQPRLRSSRLCPIWNPRRFERSTKDSPNQGNGRNSAGLCYLVYCVYSANASMVELFRFDLPRRIGRNLDTYTREKKSSRKPQERLYTRFRH